MYAHDRTCCVCTMRGRHVQIHHIDEDPSNHEFENLAVLCLECYTETQIKGGFARKLNATDVRLARTEWTGRVTERRARADALLVTMQVGTVSAADSSSYEPWMKPTDRELLELVQKIPEAMR